jgi:CheY-specific phosphatase CheX
MEQQLKSILTAVTNDTLEKLAFLFAFADEERDIDSPDPAVVGRVDFNGHFKGFLMMRISESVVPELASNMLGLDDDAQISETQQQDALQELLNVICGNALPAIAGDQVEFSIAAPEILSLMDAAHLNQKYTPACIVRMMLEEGSCDLYFYIEGEVPELTFHDNAEIGR